MQHSIEWFQNARYGLFIHFGLYAIPGGRWDGKEIPHGSEWIMRNAQIPLEKYKKLAEEFCPDGFDAMEYVKNAKKWGMKYLVFTAKHHDGFAMYDSKVSPYNIMNTPYGKDMVKELSEACKQEGLVFCLYYSQMQDWEHPDGDGNTWDYDPAKKDFKRYFYEKCIPQVKELLTNYGELGLIWFDTPYDMPETLCKELAQTVKTYQPQCLINGRIGYGLGDYRQAADNSIPLVANRNPWESPMVLNRSWGYVKRNEPIKTAREVIDNMVKVVGRGGNLLLNVGPDPKGKAPAEQVAVLDRVGAWLAQHGESIYHTVASPNFPYLIPWGEMTYREDRHVLYLHVKNYPGSPFRILLTGLKTKVEQVYLLQNGEQLKYSQSYEPARDEHRFYVFLPEACPDPNDTVVAVKLAGNAEAQAL